MTVLVWPAELPQSVRQAGFQVTPGDGVLRTKMEGGPNKARRRFSSTPHTMSVSFLVYREGLARFERFHEEETKNGSLPFVMPDPVYDGAPLAGLLTETGAPVLIVRKMLVMFAEPPNTTPFGPAFQVSMRLSVMP